MSKVCWAGPPSPCPIAQQQLPSPATEFAFSLAAALPFPSLPSSSAAFYFSTCLTDVYGAFGQLGAVCFPTRVCASVGVYACVCVAECNRISLVPKRRSTSSSSSINKNTNKFMEFLVQNFYLHKRIKNTGTTSDVCAATTTTAAQ